MNYRPSESLLALFVLRCYRRHRHRLLLKWLARHPIPRDYEQCLWLSKMMEDMQTFHFCRHRRPIRSFGCPRCCFLTYSNEKERYWNYHCYHPRYYRPHRPHPLSKFVPSPHFHRHLWWKGVVVVAVGVAAAEPATQQSFPRRTTTTSHRWRPKSPAGP